MALSKIRASNSLSKCMKYYFHRNFYQELHSSDLPAKSIRIKGLPYFPPANIPGLPEYVSTRDHESLKIIKVDPQAQNVEKKTAEFLEENIKKYAAILVKGFNIENDKDLMAITSLLPYQHMTYNSGSAYRQKVASKVYTASDEPNNITMDLHNEMAYLSNSPSKVLFCCIEEAEKGGESPISFNRDVQRDLDPNVYKKMAEKKIKYMRNLRHKMNTDYISWQQTFETDDKQEAEESMRKQGMKWEWVENGDLCIYNIVEAVRPHPRTNEEIWFNQADANHYTYYSNHPMFDGVTLKPREYPFHSCYGDNEEFEDEAIAHIRRTHWKNAVLLKLTKGDFLLMDNYLCAHSRMAFEGRRKLLVNLFA